MLSLSKLKSVSYVEVFQLVLEEKVVFLVTLTTPVSSIRLLDR